MKATLALCTLLIASATSFTIISSSIRSRRTSLSFEKPQNPNKFGKGIGRLELDEAALTAQTLYDMVLVERLQPPVETDTGLYKGQEEQPKLHICRVLSVGSGREEENGIIASMPDIKVGDTVVVKNPWGIGPKDEELADGRKLSYLKGQDVAGKIEGGILEE
ncbi:hypothetical protein TrVE_jg2334 [Triparma verrucosa]|uniref:Uncharacterized protein n=2 Tax=Triparma TaxID=722752 RepID=A0A9W7EBE7_9STRA|nr:hypothetical protein TrST_g14144 [Triparma strigata]GMI10680.1 hypothetical protein TrVE_jg2334 [Triparma verrucosa]